MCYYVLVSTNLNRAAPADAANIDQGLHGQPVRRPTMRRESTSNSSSGQAPDNPTAQQIQDKIDNLIKLQAQYLLLELNRVDRMIRGRKQG